MTHEQDQKRQANDEAAFKKRVFETVINHLEKGVARELVGAELQLLCDMKGEDAVELFSSITITTPEDQKHFARIIELLYPYEPNKTFTHSPDNLYGWLKKLSAETDHHRHLQDFNHLLQSTHARKSRALLLFFITLFTAGIGVYFYFMPEHLKAVEKFLERLMPSFWRFLEHTFSILKNIPLLLVLYNALCIPWQAYNTYFDTFRSPARRFQKWLVGTLPPLMCLTAYVLCYLAQGVFTPLAATFFIASSLVEVVNSFINLFICLNKIPFEQKDLGFFARIYYSFDKLFHPEHYLERLAQTQQFDTLEKKLDFVRQKERLYRTLKTVGVNLVAASVIAVAVTFWCVFPPSFVLMLSCIAIINCVNFTRGATLSLIHTNGAKALQDELDKTYRYHHEESLEPEQSSTPEKALGAEKTIVNTPAPELPRLKRSHSCPSLSFFPNSRPAENEPAENEAKSVPTLESMQLN